MHLPPILKIWLLKWQFLPEIFQRGARGERRARGCKAWSALRSKDLQIWRLLTLFVWTFQLSTPHTPHSHIYLRRSPVDSISGRVRRLRGRRRWRSPQSSRDDVPQGWLLPRSRWVGHPAGVARSQHRVLRGGSVLGDWNTVGAGDCWGWPGISVIIIERRRKIIIRGKSSGKISQKIIRFNWIFQLSLLFGGAI